MGDRLSKEIRLVVNAVPGSKAGFDTAIAELTRIEEQIARIRLNASRTITLRFTSNIATVAGGGSGRAGGGTGFRGGGGGGGPLGFAIPRVAPGPTTTAVPFAGQAKTATTAITKLDAKTKSYTASLKKATRSADDFNKRMVTGQKATKAMGDTIGHTTAKVALWTVSTGIIYGTLRAIKSLKDEMIATEYQVGRLQRVFAGSATEATKLKNEAIDLGAALGIVPNQAIETAVSIARLQQDRVRTLEMLRVALLAQNVAELSVEESLKFTTSAILQFNMSALQSIQVLNQWNELSNKNRVLTRDLGNAVAVAGKAFFEAGASIETLNAYVTVLAQTTGKTGAEIGTALRTIAVYAQDVRKAGIVTDITSLAIFGMGESAKPIGSIIAGLAVKFDTLTDAQRNETAKQIAGIRRRTQLLVLLREYPAVLTALTQQFDQENSALEEQAVVSRTLQFQLSQLGAEFGKLGVAAGDAGMAGFLHGTVTASRLVISAFNDNNVAGRVLLGTIQVLAARFILLHAVNLVTTTQYKTLTAATYAGARATATYTASLTLFAAASRLAAVALKGLLIATGIGVGLFVLSEALGYVYNKLLALQGVPVVLGDTLANLQALSNEAVRLQSVVTNAEDAAAALRDLYTIEAKGGKLTANQKEINDAIVEFLVAMEDGIRTREEVIQLLEKERAATAKLFALMEAGILTREEVIEQLKKEGGLEQVLADIRGAAGTADLDARAAASQAVLDKQEEILELEKKLQAQRQVQTAPSGGALALPGVPYAGIGVAITNFLGIGTEEKTKAALKQAQEDKAQIEKEESDRSREKAAAAFKEQQAFEIAEFKKTVKAKIRAQRELSKQSAKFESLFAVGDIEKSRIEINALADTLEDLYKSIRELEGGNLIGDGGRAQSEILLKTEAAKKLNIELLALEQGYTITVSSEGIDKALKKLKRVSDFDLRVVDITSIDALDAVHRKYQLIRNEIVKIQREIQNSSQLNLTAEAVQARRLQLQELEEQALDAGEDILLQQLQTMIDINKEAEKRAKSAEKSFLFADRETQAIAAGLALELQKRGGERLGAGEFALLAPDIKRIIADMVPGLLPVAALPQEEQRAMGVEPQQIGIGRFLALPPDQRREIEQTFPGITPGADPTRTQGFRIPDEILVPAENFVFPDEIVVSADRIRFGDVEILNDAASNLGDVLTRFTTSQEKLIQKWSQAFSEQKQSQVEIDVDIDFAGVEGPLNNLVSIFTNIVERRLEEKIDSVVADLHRVAKGPSRPNVNAEAF